MKVLVTGATGFIGARAAKALAARGHEVVATGRAIERPAWVDADTLEYVAGDLGEQTHLRQLFTAPPEVVIHLAWYTKPGAYLTSTPGNTRSLAASLQLLLEAQSAGCRRVVLGGTCLEVGDPPTATVYARTKRALHAIASEYFEADNPRVACAHIFSVYGPGEHPDRAIPSIIRALSKGRAVELSDGTPCRDYLHVDDVASALATVAESTVGGRIDVCSGSPRPLREIFSLLGEILERPDLLHFGKLMPSPATMFEAEGDPELLSSLGWSPSYTLAEGLRSAVEWWTNARPSDLTS